MTGQATLFPALPPLAEVCGLTDWSGGEPPCEGWWKTRRKSSPLLSQPQRRWWHADVKMWSGPVTPDIDDADAEATRRDAYMMTDQIEWCGLAKDPEPWLRGQKP